mgnify:CR=1 FL=1
MKVKVLQVGPIGTNCYILEDETTNLAAVIDPGDDEQRILAALKADGVEVKYLLLTHGHYDHTTAVPPLKQALPDAQAYIHQPTPTGRAPSCSPWPDRSTTCSSTTRGTSCPWATSPSRDAHPGHSKGSVTCGWGRALHRRHPVLRLHGPHRPAGRQL